MCMMLYIASDAVLPLVAWSEEDPQFHVTELAAEFLRDVSAQLRGDQVRYVGSYEGCGCGFQLGEYPEFEDEDASKKRESLVRLADYLEVRLETGQSVELFACWAGDESRAPVTQRRISPHELRLESFYFEPSERITVEPSP